DLPVLDDDAAPVLVRDRLVAVLEVDDREAAGREGDAAVDVLAGAVGAAVDEQVAHRAQRLDGRDAVRRRDPADSAHGSTLGAAAQQSSDRLPEHAPAG